MRVVLLLFIEIYTYAPLLCLGETIIDPGIWTVENIMQCEDADQYEIPVTIARKKLNRTHDCFTLHMNLDRIINHLYSIEVDIYKKVDGGYKFFQKLTDHSACHFWKEYAQENMEHALSSAGIYPPDCPIKPGDYTIKDFVFNYDEIKLNNLYGSYEVHTYIVYFGKRVACAKMYSRFDKLGEIDDDNDDN